MLNDLTERKVIFQNSRQDVPVLTKAEGPLMHKGLVPSRKTNVVAFLSNNCETQKLIVDYEA